MVDFKLPNSRGKFPKEHPFNTHSQTLETNKGFRIGVTAAQIVEMRGLGLNPDNPNDVEIWFAKGLKTLAEAILNPTTPVECLEPTE